MYIKFEYWSRNDTKWFRYYNCGNFKLITLFKKFHWRITRTKYDYEQLPQCGG